MPDPLNQDWLDIAPVPTGVIGPDNTWLAANPALCTFLGHPSRSLTGRKFLDFVHFQDAPAWIAILNDARDGSPPASDAPQPFLHASGEIRHGLFLSSPTQDPETLLVQIPDFQQLVNNHPESYHPPAHNPIEKTAYELTHHIPVGTYTMVLPPGSAMAHFAFMSDRFLEISGLDRQTAIANPINAYAHIHPDDYTEWIKENAHSFATRSRFYGEARLIIDNQIRWISAESIPRHLDDGTVIWEGVLADITARKTAERALADALKMEQQLRHEAERLR